ncbi:hypothetical protein ACRALDRAFT_1072802 [Sodiomyces alcalophilus JCM 7366]|uniref:uncharacterized protein n=1 Tax=Sodiomyces alcalophilus JCM 7366 TaxID=591952 RepID=UPI0039B57A99
MTNVNKFEVDDWLPDPYDRMHDDYVTSEQLRDTYMTGTANTPYSYFDRSSLLLPTMQAQPNGLSHCHAYAHGEDNGMMDHLLAWPVPTATSTSAFTGFVKPEVPAMSHPLLQGQDSLSSHLFSATTMPTNQERHHEMLMSQDSVVYSNVQPSTDPSGADRHVHDFGRFPSGSVSAGTGLETGSSFGSVDAHGSVVDMQHQPGLLRDMCGPFDSQPHPAPWLVAMPPEPVGTLSPKDLPLQGTLSPVAFSDGPVPLNLLATDEDDGQILSGDQEDDVLCVKDLAQRRGSSRVSSSNHSSRRNGTGRTTASKKRKQLPIKHQATTDRIARDEFLLVSKRKGMTYREIRAAGGFTEAESTLRGRYRTLTKSREERVRKPEWSEKDIELLKKAVRKFTRGMGPEAAKVPWKQVAEYIHQKGGSYLFGNATCRKKWDELALAERSRSAA